MIQKPITTNLLIFLNRFLTELDALLIKIENVLNKEDYDTTVNLLSKEFASIPGFFQKNRESEYEYLLCIATFYHLYEKKDTIKRPFDSYIDVVSNWRSMDEPTKNLFFELMEKNVYKVASINTYKYLLKLNLEGKIHNSYIKSFFSLIDNLLQKFVSFLIQLDKVETDQEKELLEKYFAICNTSQTYVYQDIIPIPDYIIKTLVESGYNIQYQSFNVQTPSDFKMLITKEQSKISSIDTKYVFDFVKIQKFISKKYDLILETKSILEKCTDYEMIDYWSEFLKDQIGSYNMIYFHSVNMVVSLTETELVTFYELYEKFDELGIFKTGFEKNLVESINTIYNQLSVINVNIVQNLQSISNQLNEIKYGLNQLNQTMYKSLMAIQQLEESIICAFDSLEYSIENNFNELSDTISTHLKSIDSGIAYNNLISTVSAYQLYKINKQTKSLLPKK